MNITCPHCKKRYSISDEGIKKIGERAVVPCPACKGNMRSSLDAAQAVDAQPAPDVEEAAEDNSLKSRLQQALMDLPAMPQAFDQARGLMVDAHARPADIEQLLEANPTVSALVLRLAGMAMYGDAESKNPIQQIIVALDMKVLTEFVILACASDLLARELSGYGLNAGDLWRHSLGVAYCARELATRMNPDLAEDAFLAGLFHDCGKLVLESFVAEQRESLLSLVQEEKQAFPDIERSIFGFDHPQIGADVCLKWRLPKSLTVAIALHHNPSKLEHNPLACVLHAADATAMMSGIGAGIEGALYRIDEKAMELLKVDDDRLGVLMVDAAGYVNRTMACFS